MASTPNVGRIVGGLLLLHFVGGLMLPYILLNAAIAPPGFLANAAVSSFQLRTRTRYGARSPSTREDLNVRSAVRAGPRALTILSILDTIAI